jgi:dCMP deaminase
VFLEGANMTEIQDQGIHPEKLIIIGVAGPLGSGCTTIARFLTDLIYEDEQGIQSFLETNQYIKNNRINFDKYEKEIESLYRERVKIDKKIGSITSNFGKKASEADKKKLEAFKVQAETLHYSLKKVLEDREVIESLDYLTKGEDYGKKSRYYISVSDIIIFKCLVELETDIIAKATKKTEVDQIRDIMSRKLKALKLSKQQYTNLYQDMINFYYHEETPTPPPDFPTFISCMEHVKAVKEEIVTLDNYREIMQDFGDNIRSTGSPFKFLDAFVEESEKIKSVRENVDSLAVDLDYIIHYLMSEKRYFIVVDCFRNPNTAKYFRDKYSKFYLVSLYSDHDERLRRLQLKESIRANYSFDSKAFKKKFEKYDGRDEGEQLSLEERLYKQNVTETCLISDIAINNDETKKPLFSKLIRYVGLIFDPGCTKPTADEMFMNLAYTMAMKSNCISRQAGAAIEGEKGYLVGAGWNDVGEGQISCGLRNIRDLNLPA